MILELNLGGSESNKPLNILFFFLFSKLLSENLNPFGFTYPVAVVDICATGGYRVEDPNDITAIDALALSRIGTIGLFWSTIFILGDCWL